MNLTPGVTISPGDSVTRQTIYDLIANAVAGTIQASDLHESVQTITADSNPPSPYPGKLWWDQTEQVMKVYVDVLDDTGISLWLAIGPDRFDTPVIATEPIPFGAACQFAGQGKRTVKLPPEPHSLTAMANTSRIWESWKVVGFNCNGPSGSHNTAASGTWFALGIDGYVWTWHPVNKSGLASAGTDFYFDGLVVWAANTLSGPSGISNIRGALMQQTYWQCQAQATGPGLCLNSERLNALQGQNWGRQFFFGARNNRI